MHRRRFLKLTGVSLGAAGAALGAQAEAGSKGRGQAFREVSERADERGKPLVLIPVSAAGSDVDELQRVWGELFSTVNDEHLGLLALFEFVFAETPSGAEFQAEAHCAIVRISSSQGWRPIPWAKGEELTAERLFHSLRETLVATPDQQSDLVQRLYRGRAGYGRMMRIGNAGPQTAPRLKISEADAGAALLYHGIQNSSDDAYKSWASGLLASAAALRLYENNPVGAHWADHYPEVDPCPPCGMAVVMPTSRLFLDAYTAEGR